MTQEVTPEWIRQQLRAANRTQAELATHLGFSGPDIVSKMLGGGRAIKLDEAKRIIAFFAGSGQSPGFAEGRAPQIDMSRIPPVPQGLSEPEDIVEPPKNKVDQPINRMQCARVGDLVQVAGTYDVDGLQELIDTLEFYRAQLEKKRSG